MKKFQSSNSIKEKSILNPDLQFFSDVYHKYNQIWQSVLKLTLVNNTLVDLKSFEKILLKNGIDLENPYCQFLIQTSSKIENQQLLINDISTSSNNISGTNQKQPEEILIDYKQFLNQSIKALSQEQFDNETFIIEQFWKVKFGDNNQRQSQVTIQEFNKGFYEFFNKEQKMINIEVIDAIVNECFQYALRKNKKYISKRSFRKVIKRNFKDVFGYILINLGQNPQPKATQDQNQNQCLPRDDTLGGQVQSTYYPDSLDTRSQKQYKPTTNISTNPSKSFQETSTFYNLSNNTRSKSSEGFSNNYQTNSFQHSSYDALAQQINFMAEKRKELKRNAVNTLEQSLMKAFNRYYGRRVFHKLRLNQVAQTRKELLKSRKQQMNKENLIPQKDTNFNSTIANKNKSFYEKETFSFNKIRKGHSKKNRVIEQQNYMSQDYDYDQFQEQNFFIKNHENDLNFQNLPQKQYDNQSLSNKHHKMQSYGSLQYSNTPTVSQRPYNQSIHQQNFQYDQIPVSTKSNSISARNYTQLTTQSNEYRLLSQRQMEGQFYLSSNQNNSKSHHDLYTDINKYDSTSNIFAHHPTTTDDSTMRDLEQKLREIRSGNTTTKNISKRHSSNSFVKQQANQNQNKVNQFKNLVRYSYQNKRDSNQSSLNVNESNLGFPSAIIQNQDLLTLGQPLTQTNTGTHHTHKSSRVTNFEQMNTEQDSIITDITPIQNKHNSANHFKEDHASISRILDQNPHNSILTSHIMRTQDARQSSFNQKDAIRYDRKIKKSQEKIKALEQENINQKTQYQNLQLQNEQLNDKIITLEQRFEQIQGELNKNLDTNNNLQTIIKSSQQKYSLTQILFIYKKKNIFNLRNYINRWKSQCVKQNTQNLKLENFQKIQQFKNTVQFFGSWVRYAITRKTRKEKRKIYKLQVKALRCIIRRIMLIKQKKLFNFWKGPFMKTILLDEVQKDMQFAHEQMRQMRNIVSFNKLDHIVEKHSLLLKSFAFNQLFLNEFTKRSFNAETSEQLLTQQKSFSTQKNNRQLLSPLNTQQISINQMYQPQYNQFLQNQQVQYPFTSQYEEEQQLIQVQPNYQQKAQMQRKQSRFIEGIEILYNVLKRQCQLTKDDYFSIWKHQTFTINDQQIYDEQQQEYQYDEQYQTQDYQQVYPQQETFTQPDYIFNNASGDLDTSQEIPQNLMINPSIYNHQNENERQIMNLNQVLMPQEPCYYKTNEGYFYPNQQQLISPGKQINKPKRIQLVEYSIKYTKSITNQCDTQALSIELGTYSDLKYSFILKQQQLKKGADAKIEKLDRQNTNI